MKNILTNRTNDYNRIPTDNTIGTRDQNETAHGNTQRHLRLMTTPGNKIRELSDLLSPDDIIPT